VEFKYYESGHMAYLNQTSAKQLKNDITAFIRSTAHPTQVTVSLK
jgi:carboxypeptidase C (cathepsin A)